MLTIIIPFFNGHEHIDRLISSIPDNIETIIIDDMSDKPLETAGNAKIIRLDKKSYFTGAVNRGLKEIKNNSDVLILNQDTYFTGNKWLRMLRQNRKEYALIGEGVLRHKVWQDGYIHGVFMFIRRDALKNTGLMDEEFYPLWGSTCDYQLRAVRKGYKALPIPQDQIPDFAHSRKGSYGSSIKQLLSRDKRRGLFIRTPPMISVVIGCYNHGQFLPDAINSLIGGKTCLGDHPGQSFQGFEVIIVDDGSTDNTPEICSKLISSQKGIRYIRQENYGSAAAMNKGIQNANGKYIAALDADDMMEPERLRNMLRLQEDNPHSVIYDDVAYFSQVGNTWTRGFRTKKGWELIKELPRQYNFENIIYKNAMHKGLMFPKKAWEEAGGYPTVMNKGREDWAFNVALGINGWCGIHTGQADYLYRRNWTSRTFTNTTPDWHKIFRQQMMDLYPEIYQGVRPNMCCGNGSRRSTNAKPAAKAMSLPGAESGMVILEYNGLNSGDETWIGPETKTIYVLGGIKKRSYVDKKDAGSRPTQRSDGSGMLAMREGNRYLFNLYEPPKVEEPKPEPAPVIEIAQNEPTMITEDVELQDKIVLSLDMTIKDLNDALLIYDYTKLELVNLLDKEESKEKPRKGFVSALRDAIKLQQDEIDAMRNKWLI